MGKLIGSAVTFGLLAVLGLQACDSGQSGDDTGSLPGSLPATVNITEASDPAAITELKRQLVSAIKEEEACGTICASPIDVLLQWKTINDLISSLPQSVLGDAGTSSSTAFDELYSCYAEHPNANLAQCDSEYRKWHATLAAVIAASV
ncbi:MAG: hypothetical protein ACOYMR_09455 [Ilumatobacteraceae bacterium]